MTNPGPGGQWPQQGGPQQGAAAGQYGTPQQPYQGQPYGTPPFQQGPQFPQGQPPFGPAGAQGPWQPGQPAPSKSRRGLVIGLVIALVVVLGGGATWFAVTQTNSVTAGASTPAEAAEKLAGSLGNGDVVGLLSTLVPAEAALLTDPLAETTAELQRVGILDESADPSRLTGLRLETQGLVFDSAQEERINDHLTITKLTGGTMTVTADLSTIPLSEEFIDAALTNTEKAELEQGPQTRTVDIAEFVRKMGGPIRIATVKADEQWYPSLLYTMADYALREEGTSWPAESIPANGATSPQEAVRETLQAGLDADVRRVIELLPPDEMGVLHDAGPAILEAVGAEAEATGVTVTRLETENSEVTGGTRATISMLEMTKNGGASRLTLSKDRDCYQLTIDDDEQRLCAGELAGILGEEAGSDLPPEARQMLANLGSGLLEQGLGVVTTEVDGKHYVSPVRTFTELGMTVLRSLRPEDVGALLRMAD